MLRVAAATEMTVNAAVCQNRMALLHLKNGQKLALMAFLSGQLVSVLLSAGFGYTLQCHVKHCSV